MIQDIQRIFTLSKTRIENFQRQKDDRYQGAQTYFTEIRKEIDEAQDENKADNTIYLEDELGDIFWDYITLLNALASEGKITSPEKVFERCYQKFSGRINEQGEDRGEWKDIKVQQKLLLQAEHQKTYKEK